MKKTTRLMYNCEDFCDVVPIEMEDTDEVLSCCSDGCTITAWDYARWNGKCAYQGQ